MKRYESLVVGHNNPDITMYTRGNMPRAGIEILADGMALELGGSSCLTAVSLCALGIHTALCARVGEDFYGQVAVKLLAEMGLSDERMVRDAATPTGVTVSITSPSDRAMVSYLGTTAKLCADDVPSELLGQTRHLHVGGFYLLSALRPALPELFKRAHENGATVSLDTGWDDSGAWDGGIRSALEHVDFFFPNESEAAALTGHEDPEQAARALSQLGPTVVVKCGADGAVLARGGRVLRKAGFPVADASNLTGAGDSFNAGFLYGLLRGRPPEGCLALGNANAAWRIARPRGARSRQTSELIERIAREGRV
ncbi:MAG: PfkB family carbohydrate kinase [Christensenellaceae bacterium]|nr:PfkB family carbohydrate kinase [Christensenellaceae bacterium]